MPGHTPQRDKPEPARPARPRHSLERSKPEQEEYVHEETDFVSPARARHGAGITARHGFRGDACRKRQDQRQILRQDSAHPAGRGRFPHRARLVLPVPDGCGQQSERDPLRASHRRRCYRHQHQRHLVLQCPGRPGQGPGQLHPAGQREHQRPEPEPHRGHQRPYPDHRHCGHDQGDLPNRGGLPVRRRHEGGSACHPGRGELEHRQQRHRHPDLHPHPAGRRPAERRCAAHQLRQPHHLHEGLRHAERQR